MIRSCMRAIWYGPMLLVVCLLPAPGRAQEPAPAISEPSAAPQSAPASSSQPVTPPQAYRINPGNLLVYSVHINTRSAQTPGVTERIERHELALFDVDAEGNVVLYIGAPKDTKPTSVAPPAPPPPPAPAAPHSGPRREGQNRPAQPVPAEPKPDKPKNVEMTWTKYSLGQALARNNDGTILLRPDSSAGAYPVLPLPPADSKEKDKFGVTLPDIAAGTGKTIQLAGTWKATANDKITVDAKLEPRITPGVPPVPELAMFGYDVSRNDPAAVTRISENRKLPSEAPPAMPAEHAAETPHPAPGVHPQTPHPAAGAKPTPGVKPAPKPAAPSSPWISVAITLDKAMPISDEMRKGMVTMARGGTPGDSQTEQATPANPQGLIDQMQEQGAKEPKARGQ